MIILKKLDPKNQEQCGIFRQLMCLYSHELDRQLGQKTPEDMLDKWIQSIINAESLSSKRYLYIAEQDGQAVGFFYGKVDCEEDRGNPRPGWGYVMEFFVIEQLRRRGIGTAMYHELESLFRHDGASCFYLTANSAVGKPFWMAQGFSGTGTVSPENGLELLEKRQ